MKTESRKRCKTDTYTQAGIETYKLKGAAGNLGAYALQKACVKLEADIKARIIKPATLIDFSTTLNQVLTACIDYLTPTQAAKVPLNYNNDLQQRLTELWELLDGHEWVSKTCLREIEERLPSEAGPVMETLTNHLNNLDYERAQNTLHALIQEYGNKR